MNIISVVKLDKKFFIISFILHILIIVGIFFLVKDNQIHRGFIVFGAHSKKPSHAFFQSNKKIKTGYYKVGYNTGYNNGNIRKTGINKISGGSFKCVDKVKSRAKENSKLIKNKKTSKKIKSNNIKDNSPVIKKDKDIINKKVKNKKNSKKLNKIKIVEKPVIKKVEKVEEKKIITPKKEIKVEKKENIKEEIKQTEEMPKITENNSEQLNNLAPVIKDETLVEEQSLGDQEELNFDLQGSVDEKMSEYHKNVQKEVERLWRPPVGISKGTECMLSFLVDKLGNISEYQIVKKSDVLIYDLSVLRIAKDFKFDECLWGKKFTITFRQ